MVQILPTAETFGSQFAKALGNAATSAAEGYASSQMEKRKLKNFQDLMNQGQSPQQRDIKKEFLDALPIIEQMSGGDLSPENLDEIWKKFQENAASQPELGSQLQGSQGQPKDYLQKSKAATQAGLPKEYIDLFNKEADIEQKNDQLEKKQKFSREQSQEDKIDKIQSRLHASEMSDLRQEKLQQLFSSKNEKQFPPSTLAAVFTKDGELNPIALSQLSTDAQESIKLLADEVQGVKDTFGSQITGFEVRRFLARLPSLLNTPEGKRRVINDLRMMNKINRDYDQGVLDIIDKHGGPGEISLSKATNIYKKENAQKIKEMRKAFLNPESAEFSELPDASMFSGREIEDPEMGKSFKSNGKEWIPQ